MNISAALERLQSQGVELTSHQGLRYRIILLIEAGKLKEEEVKIGMTRKGQVRWDLGEKHLAIIAAYEAPPAGRGGGQSKAPRKARKEK
jgi:hypothetical protein